MEYKLLEKLSGMFAFAIYDIRLETLFIARDRSGENHSIFQTVKKGFYFASELKAIMAFNALNEKLIEKHYGNI